MLGRNVRGQALIIVSAALLMISCQGRIDGSVGSGSGSGGGTGGVSPGTGSAQGTGGVSGGGGGGGGGTTGGTGTGGAGTVQLDCKVPHAAPVRLRLLSSRQYDHTLEDLLKVTGEPGKDLGDKEFEQLDDTRVEQRANVAADVAHQAALNLAQWSPCVPPASGVATTCEQQIIDKVGASAFRHPLAVDERAQMKALFDAGIKDKDFATGVEWFLTGLLQSPDFIYEVVKPSPTEQVGDSVPLAPYEYASRLAYFMWNSLPDDKLLAAAAAGELSDATKRQVHLTRMLQDPRFMRGVEAFYSRWLNLAGFAEVARDAAGFNQAVVSALSTSVLMTATQLYSAAAPNISGLFSGDSYFMNDVLRAFYGLPAGGVAFTAAQMTAQNRRGILTHPGLMALLARPKESFPIARGLFILRTLLCRSVPLPNGLVIPALPPIQEGLSTRERLEAHATNMLCQGCHNMIDPPGFALENFDEVGKFRTVDHGRPVVTSGTLALGGDLDGPFATGDDLLSKLPNSATVRSCFAEQYLKFSLSRQETDPADGCSVQALGKTFAPSGDLKQLVLSIVGSDAFRLRLAEGVAK